MNTRKHGRGNWQNPYSQTYHLSRVVPFEVANTKGGNYQLLKYDDSGDPANGPWTTLWSAPYGSEFHAGHGPKSVNTFKVAVNVGKFTLSVNNKVVGNSQDGSLKSGLVGMLVNLNKTEVAFSKLLLTYK